jgi:predicted LPLAT superfamily acyltransferase
MARGIRIHVATAQDAVPFGGLEALQFMREGGIVSLAGDIVWTDQRSLVPVRLFGREVGLPSGPHLLALVSGAPLFTLFTFRVKRGEHRIILSGPRWVKSASRSERNAAIQASAQEYAAALEEMVRQYPSQWYIFEPFFSPLPERSTAKESGP